MWGYVRRKITYSAGAGRVNNPSTGSPHRVTTNGVSANPFSWFNGPVEEDPIISSCIIDNGQAFFIDENYVELGIQEGWLVWEGYHWDSYGNPWKIFTHH